MTDVQDERVLVVPTALFHRLGHFQGFCYDVDRYLGDLLDPANIEFRPRGEVEEDPSFKQLIPYAVFQHREDDGRLTLFQYTRGGGGGEGRLHSKRSVGVGGHISAEDAEGKDDPYQAGFQRELNEEVIVRTAYHNRCAGMINDDETPVGQVHLGVVHVLEVESTDVLPRESDIDQSGFEATESLLEDLDRFESWSQIVLRALFA